MADIKRYVLTYQDDFEMTVEIDRSVMTDEKLHEINNFWTSAEDRIDEHGTVLAAVLKMLCSTFMQVTTEMVNPIRAFDWSAGHGQEGWPAMDGTAGIKIIRYDDYEFSYDYVELREEPAPA